MTTTRVELHALHAFLHWLFKIEHRFASHTVSDDVMLQKLNIFKFWSDPQALLSDDPELLQDLHHVLPSIGRPAAPPPLAPRLPRPGCEGDSEAMLRPSAPVYRLDAAADGAVPLQIRPRHQARRTFGF